MKFENCAAPIASYFDFIVLLLWGSVSSIWRLVGAYSTSTINKLLSSSNLLFWTAKSANRRLNSALSTFSFSANCANGNVSDRDLRFYRVAAGKMAQVSWQHPFLPPAQFSFESSHCSVHVCDGAPPFPASEAAGPAHRDGP